jgi:hypothetical protein
MGEGLTTPQGEHDSLLLKIQRHSHERGLTRWYDLSYDIQEVGYWDVDWIELAQDRDRWRAIVNALMILWVQ